MGRRALSTVPPDLREWLDRELVRRRFRGYTPVTTALNAKLAERGLAAVGHSAVHEYGRKMSGPALKLIESLDLAREIQRRAPDDECALPRATVTLLQEKILQALGRCEAGSKEYVALARAAANLGRTSVALQKWAVEHRERTARAARAAAPESKKRGLSAETVAEIKRRILGIPGPLAGEAVPDGGVGAPPATEVGPSPPGAVTARPAESATLDAPGEAALPQPAPSAPPARPTRRPPAPPPEAGPAGTGVFLVKVKPPKRQPLDEVLRRRRWRSKFDGLLS